MPQSPEEQLEAAIAECYSDPLRYVLLAFPWGQPGTSLAAFGGPDAWQTEFLTRLGQEVVSRGFNGRDAVPAVRMAVSSGHGVGKSALTAWIVCWIMSTRPNCVGTITANTFKQLETKTWAAIQKWSGMAINSHWFKVTSDRMEHVASPKTWYCTAQTCAEENSEAFAGQHAVDSTSFYIFDEASAISDKIFEVAEGGLTDGAPMEFMFGNPTQSTGKFYRAVFGSERNRWISKVIDSRQAALTNKAQIEEWIEDYGEDSDFVRVRVRGLPPRASSGQFIDSERVFDAQRRPPFHFPDDPLVVGLDVARGGEDNCVFWFRRGNDATSIPPIVIPGESVRDSMILVTRASHILETEYGGVRPAVMFIDGGAMGGPIADRLKQLGHKNVVEIQFGSNAPDNRYVNMRTFMWSRMRDWLVKGSIPYLERLETDLTGPNYKMDAHDRIVLEQKKDMKKRGLASTDYADALALTFAQPVGPGMRPELHSGLVLNLSASELTWMA